jgi:hypothetical protein
MTVRVPSTRYPDRRRRTRRSSDSAVRIESPSADVIWPWTLWEREFKAVRISGRLRDFCGRCALCAVIAGRDSKPRTSGYPLIRGVWAGAVARLALGGCPEGLPEPPGE